MTGIDDHGTMARYHCWLAQVTRPRSILKLYVARGMISLLRITSEQLDPCCIASRFISGVRTTSEAGIYVPTSDRDYWLTLYHGMASTIDDADHFFHAVIGTHAIRSTHLSRSTRWVGRLTADLWTMGTSLDPEKVAADLWYCREAPVSMGDHDRLEMNNRTVRGAKCRWETFVNPISMRGLVRLEGGWLCKLLCRHWV